MRILVTSIGGNFSHDLIRALRKDKKNTIIGCDLKKNKNFKFTNYFFQICNPKDEKKYISELIKACKKFKIKIIIPCSENECLVISKNLKKFEKLKIETSVSNYKITSMINDKHKVFEYLNFNNIDVGKWMQIKNLNDLKKGLKILNYPKVKVILKPKQGSGSRGILIFNKAVKKFKYLLEDSKRFCGEGTYHAIIKEMKKKKKNLSNTILMPYYDNYTFDVDCLASQGNLKYCIPRMRQYENPLSPINQGCVITENKKIINYCRKIVKVLNLNGACDFDVVIRNDKKPQLLDASCRLSGSSTASLAIGINIPLNLIYMLQKKKIKLKKIIRPVTVFPQSRFEKVF
jgi:biotin carboxylase